MSANENTTRRLSEKPEGVSGMTQLLEETRTSNQLLSRQLRITQVLAGLLAAAVLVLGVQTFFTTRAVNQLLNGPELALLTEKVAQLDVEGLNQAVDSLAEQVEALDMDGINKALAEIGAAAKGIENAVGTLNRITGIFGR